jgi:chondroitin-sulfate-ABC endolyase/exolyase
MLKILLNQYSFACLLLGVIAPLNIAMAQNDDKPAVESFESEDVLKLYKATNSQLELSNDHYRFGKTSLKWEWENGGSFSSSNFRILSHDESPLAYGAHFPASPTFAISFYNEIPQSSEITVSFGKDGKKEAWFNLPMNFTGWRRVWVPFYEMEGNAPKKLAAIDYNFFKVETKAAKGKLFFDDIIFSQYQDDRHQYPDLIVPFIKADEKPGLHHWMPLMLNYERIQNLKPQPVSVAVKMDLIKFQKRIDESLRIPSRYKANMERLKQAFNKLNLVDNGKTILGPPLTFRHSQEFFDKKQQGPERFNDITALGKALRTLANYHDRTNPEQREELERMFIMGTKYFLDQGWQGGSSGGTRHHIGYALRDVTQSFYVMRHVLRKEGLLKDVSASLHWLYNLGKLLGEEKDFHVNIDYLNTQSYYHLMIIFMFEKAEEQAALLKAYSNLISVTLAQQDEDGGFKIDGTSWHHSGHYPAYGMGAFKVVPRIIEILSKTRFRISTQGHRNFKNALLTTRAYSQMYDWGFGNAGRHPFEYNTIKKTLKQQFLQMARAGNPECTTKIDKEVAAAYLRLWGKEDPINASLFKGVNGIHEEVMPGYITMPYAATAIHRNRDWAAIIKGYSKYVWASEIYVASNRYGRYPANGTIQLLNKGGEKGSGFQQEGWDWNRYPGATVIHLPLKELEPKMPLIMFKSNETFAGAVEMDGDGVFGMILNEGKGSNADGPQVKVGFPGRLKAKKSIFSFGEKLICIGTDISSIDKENPTQTNLFQTFLPKENRKDPMFTSAGKISKFPYANELTVDSKNKKWLTDPYGNGYYILSDSEIHIKKENQDSYHNKYSINTGKMNPKGKGAKETKGDFASAWINHGMAPTNASYQYVIYPFLKGDDAKSFGNKVQATDSFEIMRADGTAHIVLDKETSTTGYSIFEADQDLESGLLKEVSSPSLLMLRQEDNNNLTISAVEPDLNFVKRVKGSHKAQYSLPVELTITIKGKWTTAITDKILSVDNSTDVTVITMQCKDGFSNKFNLTKLKGI